MTAQQVINLALKYVGTQQYGSVHKALIDRYNKVTPRPSGYKMTYDDAWCDAFVTVIADETGTASLIGRECGVERHIKLFKQMGIWLGRVKPKVGDLITFDWDGGGFADHIGFVAEVSGDILRTVEGNANARVAQVYFDWNDWRIKGFARPKYSDEKVNVPVLSDKTMEDLASEVLSGKWGNNPAREKALKVAGHDPVKVQRMVNELIAKRIENVGKDADKVKVLPNAMTYYTGQKIASWVLGAQFDVLERKAIRGGEVYLLGYKGDVIGWMRDKDVTVI